MNRDEKPEDQSPQLIYPRGLLADYTLVESIIASMSDGVMVIARQGEIVLVNSALCDILGMPAGKIKGRGWADLFFEKPGNDEFNQILVDAIQQKQEKHHNSHVTYVTPAGENRHLAATTTILTQKSDGKQVITGVLLVLHDITELVELNQREKELLLQSRRLFQEKMEGLDRLARAVAHVIRNPVMSIGGLVRRMIGRDNNNPENAAYYEHIMAGTLRLEQIVRAVRLYADIPAPRLVKVDLGVWLSEVVAPCRSRAGLKGVALSLSGLTGRAGEAEARVDPETLGQCIGIMTDNALEAMPDGGTLDVGLQVDDSKAYIAIADTGKGIAEKDLPFLFDPFFSNKAEAVGMSLAIAKRVASDHQGDITVESSPGRGSVFTLSFPLRLRLEENNPQPARPPSWR